MIIIKSEREISLMKKAGEIVSDLFDYLSTIIVPGVSTLYVSERADEFVASRGGRMAEKGYMGFPGAICASINECLIHGIPRERTVLKDGDLLKVDVVVEKDGYLADAARSYPVGICKPEVGQIVEAAKACFEEAVSLVKEGVRLGDVCHAIGEKAGSLGYSVPRDYTGHGIGRHMHEDPYIPNYGVAGTGPVLKEGMTLAIEPMLLAGKPATRVLSDGWGVVSKDGKLTAHYENTIVVRKDGYEILTIR